MPKLYYFQAPTFTINPDSDTAPKLGSIFSTLDRLTGPLNQFDYVSVPTSLTNQSASTDFKETVENGHMGSVGLNANIAQGIAGSADIVYAFARDKKYVYACDHLETLEFEPNQQFIADCITASMPVQTFMENSLLGRKRVYMVTGLKIATGFRTSMAKEMQHGPSLRVGVDAMAFGAPVPLEAGPEVEFEASKASRIEQGRSENRVIFAYRVVRIRLKRDGTAKYKWKSGGKYSVDDDDSDEEDGELWDIEPLDEDERLKEFPDSVKVDVEI
ncbi:hypothetical protein K458DRAFT_414001 [Lentithecium fluviatile CBS 122367]|uniref:Uncharacterized protein n=1 Tax=Lentithecium fluviatile CBS 122367 TaxID=1168545 RepID=A0A6G1JHN4_9PLEO|nr:hypothetical protein K458DRAFT_414001 [Lentithecium fluviatile CBS 122367]